MFNTELKEFILSRMKHSEGNIKPVIVIDDNTTLSKCYIVNDTLTDFYRANGHTRQIIMLTSK